MSYNTSIDRYAIIRERNKQYDSLFYFAVTTTGIYCRPSCPAPRPHDRNVLFFDTPQLAVAAGFRACKRCHPDQTTGQELQHILSALQEDTAGDTTLETVATKLGMSSRHLRRLVRTAVGTSPSKIKQGRQLAAALELLVQTTLPITDVAFRAGFASVRQFNQLFKTTYSMAPQVVRRTGISYSDGTFITGLAVITTDTPVGPFHMIADQQDIVRASGFGSIQELVMRLPQPLQAAPLHTVTQHPYCAHIQHYFKGDTTALSAITRSQSGTVFQQRVWDAISAIEYGQTASYSQLANHAGSPHAVRAAGTSCGQNRLILLVPCHRVLKSDGSIGNYLYGAGIKARLLELEHAR